MARSNQSIVIVIVIVLEKDEIGERVLCVMMKQGNRKQRVVFKSKIAEANDNTGTLKTFHCVSLFFIKS